MTPKNNRAEPPGRAWVVSSGVLLLALALAVVVWLASGFYTVAPGETGVVLRFGGLHKSRATVGPGIHYALPWPIDRVFTPDTKKARHIEVGFRNQGELFTEERRSDALTGDENILKIMMVVQYKIADPAKYLFDAEEPHWLVERSVESAMNQSIASLPVDDVLTTAKNQMQIETIALAQSLLDSYDAGIVLLGGNLQEVSPPVPVQAAFNDVASAKKDCERKTDEAREDKSKITLSAGGQAQQMLSEAQAYHAERIAVAKGDADRFLKLLAEYRNARTVTRTRLYVDAMERIFSSTKIIILDESAADRSKITIVEQAGS